MATMRPQNQCSGVKELVAWSLGYLMATILFMTEKSYGISIAKVAVVDWYSQPISTNLEINELI